MPVPGIIPAASTGGESEVVLHFPDALERYPNADLGIYNRVSSWGQAGKGKVELEEKTAAVYRAIRQQTERRLLFVVRGVEKGKLPMRRRKRKTLLEAVERARAMSYRNPSSSNGRQRVPIILVASDLSRFIRAEAYYHHGKNREARPTLEEFALLRKMTDSVILATLLDPTATEAERHKRTMEQAGKCGRPPKPLPSNIALRILDALGYQSAHPVTGRRAWETSIAKVAKRFGVAQARVQRLLDWPVPGMGGLLLKDCDCNNPAEVYAVAMEQGWA